MERKIERIVGVVKETWIGIKEKVHCTLVFFAQILA